MRDERHPQFRGFERVDAFSRNEAFARRTTPGPKSTMYAVSLTTIAVAGPHRRGPRQDFRSPERRPWSGLTTASAVAQRPPWRPTRPAHRDASSAATRESHPIRRERAEKSSTPARRVIESWPLPKCPPTRLRCFRPGIEANRTHSTRCYPWCTRSSSAGRALHEAGNTWPLASGHGARQRGLSAAHRGETGAVAEPRALLRNGGAADATDSGRCRAIAHV